MLFSHTGNISGVKKGFKPYLTSDLLLSVLVFFLSDILSHITNNLHRLHTVSTQRNTQ